MFKPIESYRQTYLALDAYGEPIAVLTRRDGVTDKDMDVFRKVQIPNAVELTNLAEYLEEELEKPATEARIADMTRTRRRKGLLGFNFIDEQQYSLNDAKSKIINESIAGFIRIKDKFVVQPRTPQPKPLPGERGREQAKAAQSALQSAQKVDPKIAKLIEKRDALNEEILRRDQELAVERSRREAKVIQEAEQRNREAKPPQARKGFIQKWKEALAVEESQNPRKAEAIRQGLVKA